MQPREIVLESIHHRQPPEVPYTLGFEGDVEQRLDAYYGGAHWRERLTRYIWSVAAVDTDLKVPIDDVYTRDAYGGIWREDRRPWHLERPPLARPTFEGYTFPAPEVFLRPDWKEDARQAIAQDRGQTFVIGSLGWGLFERSWNLRGFENLLMDAVAEEDFFAEALDRLMNLYLAFVDYTCELPIDAIMFGDDWGDQRGVILGPRRWRKFIKPRWARSTSACTATASSSSRIAVARSPRSCRTSSRSAWTSWRACNPKRRA